MCNSCKIRVPAMLLCDFFSDFVFNNGWAGIIHNVFWDLNKHGMLICAPVFYEAVKIFHVAFLFIFYTAAQNYYVFNYNSFLGLKRFF